MSLAQVHWAGKWPHDSFSVVAGWTGIWQDLKGQAFLINKLCSFILLSFFSPHPGNRRLESDILHGCCCFVTVMSNTLRPHGLSPPRFLCPWDFPGKNTGVGCHFLCQCMKMKSESEVAQSCPTLSDPMDCSPPGSSVHGIFQARVLEWVPLPSPIWPLTMHNNRATDFSN